MRRVYKYPLKLVDQQELQLPANSKILSVQTQGNGIVLYALINDSVVSMRKHLVIIHGTGHNADDTDGSDFVGTVSLGCLVFHIFTRRLLHDKF